MSEQLKQARIKAGITLQEIANRSGLSRPTVEKAERGKEAVTPVNAAKIVNTLNMLAGTNYSVESLNILVSQ